jgi:hypothetical protein
VLIESNQSCSTQPVLEAGHKVPQTLRQIRCQILQSRDTGCFFLYHRYTTAQLPLANTSNSRAHTVQLFSAHGEPKLAVTCEILNWAEAFYHLLGIVAILRLSFTPYCNKPEPAVYTHTNTNVNITGSHKSPSLPLALHILLTKPTQPNAQERGKIAAESDKRY